MKYYSTLLLYSIAGYTFIYFPMVWDWFTWTVKVFHQQSVDKHISVDCKDFDTRVFQVFIPLILLTDKIRPFHFVSDDDEVILESLQYEVCPAKLRLTLYDVPLCFVIKHKNNSSYYIFS